MNASRLLDPASVRKWTTLKPLRNLLHVLAEHAQILCLQAGAILLFERADDWGLPLWTLVPAALLTIVLTGILIHRIAMLGHEASHSLLCRSRQWNDLLADLLCFFPFWSSLSNYRRKHSGHHHHPNQAGRDPNLATRRAEKLFAGFPLDRPSGIFRYYALFFWPPFVLGNLVEIFLVLGFGPGGRKRRSSASRRKFSWPGWLTPRTLGTLHLVALFFLLAWAKNAAGYTSGAEGSAKSPALLVAAPLAFHFLVGLGGVLLLPPSAFENAGGALRYHRRLSAFLRLSFGAGVLMVTTWCRQFFGLPLGHYYLLFWLVPIFYVVPYLMLLREVYQHANLGTGTLDNARIIHADPFTRWALLPYGNDFHLVHHIYPNIPHYHLRTVHSELFATSEDYRSQLREVQGNVLGERDIPSVSESLAAAPPERAKESSPAWSPESIAAERAG